MDMAQKTRDGLRSALLGSKKLKSEIITIFDQEVEIRQPTIGKMSQMAKRTTDNPNMSPIVTMLIEYCFVPGTSEHVFAESDQQALAELPAGKWLNDVNSCIERLTGLSVTAAEKNSEKTPSA